jgi:hypothetical protein
MRFEHKDERRKSYVALAMKINVGGDLVVGTHVILILGPAPPACIESDGVARGTIQVNRRVLARRNGQFGHAFMLNGEIHPHAGARLRRAGRGRRLSRTNAATGAALALVLDVLNDRRVTHVVLVGRPCGCRVRWLGRQPGNLSEGCNRRGATVRKQTVRKQSIVM